MGVLDRACLVMNLVVCHRLGWERGKGVMYVALLL
jgi:hypothetical protein